jgi:hypothetical protein
MIVCKEKDYKHTPVLEKSKLSISHPHSLPPQSAQPPTPFFCLWERGIPISRFFRSLQEKFGEAVNNARADEREQGARVP